MSVSDQSDNPEARKLLSSMLDQGIAATLTDYLWAAKALGMQDWAFDQAKRQFEAMDSESAQEIINATQQQAKLLTVEMSNLTELLVNAGYESTTVHAMLATFSQVMHSKRIPFADLKKD
jgi:Rod binding domain-containing protein